MRTTPWVRDDSMPLALSIRAELPEPLVIPLVSGQGVVMNGNFPLTPAAWDHFIRILEAMKPGLVEQPISLPPDDETQP